MYRTCASRLAFCIALLVPLGLEVRADPIRMTVTGDAGIGPVNYSQVLADGTLDGGYYSGPGALGSRYVGPDMTGRIDAPISLTIGLTDTAAPDSQGLTLSLSGSLTGQFFPMNGPNGPTVGGSGTINAITISGLDPATNQVVSATTQGPNGMLNADALAKFASISSIPQSLLATLTTPSQYRISPWMGGGIEGFYYSIMSIAPLSPAASVPTPEPSSFAILGLATVAYLVRRAWAVRKDAIPRG